MIKGEIEAFHFGIDMWKLDSRGARMVSKWFLVENG